MPNAEGYQPSPADMRDADLMMDDRQRELTETREDALFEGRKQGIESVINSEMPREIQQAIELGRFFEGIVTTIDRVSYQKMLRKEDRTPGRNFYDTFRDDIKKITLEPGKSYTISNEMVGHIRLGDQITAFENTNGRVLGIKIGKEILDWDGKVIYTFGIEDNG